jgi:hypothetical protein
MQLMMNGATELGQPWTVLLPCALEGEYNLLLVEYTPWQQQQSAAWLAFATRLAADFASLRCYLLSVRHHAPQSANRKAMLADISAKDLSLFLVQQNGAILWREQGDWSPAKADALDDFLLAVMPLGDAFG